MMMASIPLHAVKDEGSSARLRPHPRRVPALGDGVYVIATPSDICRNARQGYPGSNP
jgi:hypothetical protein